MAPFVPPMKSTIDCFDCMIRQSLRTARLVGVDEARQDRVVRSVMGHLLGTEPGDPPIEIALGVQEVVRATTGVADPYEKIRRRSNARAGPWGRRLERLVPEDPLDALERSLRIAVAGNVIDYGPAGSFDLGEVVDRCLHRPAGPWDRGLLAERLKTANRIAFLADNAGEIVFDRILLRVLRERFGVSEILFVVREHPFLNDALTEDAVRAGIASLPGVTVAAMGPGIPEPGDPTDPVWQSVRSADLRLAKGQANAEIFDEEEDFFLLFLVKCKQVARAASLRTGRNVEAGDMALLHTGRGRVNPGNAA